MSDEQRTALKGAGFLVADAQPEEVFTPADMNQDQQMISDLARDFFEQRVHPNVKQLESLDYELTHQLMKEAGELGLLGVDMPEEHGGLALDKISSALVTEKLSGGGGFGVTLSDHTGIGSLPIVFFGSEEQKARYLPKMATGEWIGAYALTEPGAGSDALGIRTTAKLNEEGTHYILNGTKQFITNAGIADLFITYAKVDGEHFTGFIIDADSAGLSVGPELNKMGLKGSSTCQVTLKNVAVPVENVLGEIGRGHVIAFCILDLGRFKLGAGALGGSKQAMGLAVEYASKREQFDQPLLQFPLIGRKLASMAVDIYALESVVFRTAGLLDQELQAEGVSDDPSALADVLGDYATEVSINKVFGSEVLDRVVDEALQVHGGYGYMREYEIERAYRDSRINRIFEGTNEINRLLIPQTIVRRAMKGDLPLMEAVQRANTTAFPEFEAEDGELPSLKTLASMVSSLKQVFLLAGGLVVETFGMSLREEQELLANLADIVIQVFAAESSLLRAQKLAAAGDADQELAHQLTALVVDQAAGVVEDKASESLLYLGGHRGDQRTQALRKKLVEALEQAPSLDRVGLLRQVAEVVADRGGYPFA